MNRFVLALVILLLPPLAALHAAAAPAASKTNITLIGYGATLRMWTQDYSQSAAFYLLGTTGQFWFWVPPGTKEFGVKVSGGGSTECVKAALHDPAGTKVEDQDNIAQAHQFVATPKDTGEIWSLRSARPAGATSPTASASCAAPSPRFTLPM